MISIQNTLYIISDRFYKIWSCTTELVNYWNITVGVVGITVAAGALLEQTADEPN